MRRINALLFAAFVLVGASVSSSASTGAATAWASETTYTPESPTLDTVSGGPWNTAQGDSSAGAR